MTRRTKYLETLNRPKLDEKQKELLVKFIQEFLPSTGEKRRYGYNSLSRVHTTLDQIFLNNIGYGISERDVIDVFLIMNYGFRTIVPNWSPIKIPSTVGFYEQVYEEIKKIRQIYSFDEYSIHISVSANDVKELYFSQKRLPIENGNSEKTIEPRIQLKKEIKMFFGLPPNLKEEDFIPKYLLKEKEKINKNTD